VQQVTNRRNLASSEFKGAEVPENQMAVSPVGLKLVTVFRKLACEHAGVSNDFLCIFLELGLCSELESNCDSSNGLPNKNKITEVGQS